MVPPLACLDRRGAWLASSPPAAGAAVPAGCFFFAILKNATSLEPAKSTAFSASSSFLPARSRATQQSGLATRETSLFTSAADAPAGTPIVTSSLGSSLLLKRDTSSQISRPPGSPILAQAPARKYDPGRSPRICPGHRGREAPLSLGAPDDRKSKNLHRL